MDKFKKNKTKRDMMISDDELHLLIEMLNDRMVFMQTGVKYERTVKAIEKNEIMRVLNKWRERKDGA